MLLDSEVRSGEIYVSDKEISIIMGEEKPQLFQLVQDPKVIKREGMFGECTTDTTNPIFENLKTGELVNWGTHCFTTIERMKKQYANIDSITDKRRAEYVSAAYDAITAYEDASKSE